VREFHHRYSADRRQALIDPIARGIREGDFRADLDPELAAVALLGTIFYRRPMTGEPFDPNDAGDLVRTILGSPR
jgi:hypothetical protein